MSTRVPCKPYCVYLSFPSELLYEVDGDGAALAQREVVPVLQDGNLVLRVHLKVISLVAPSIVFLIVSISAIYSVTSRNSGVMVSPLRGNISTSLYLRLRHSRVRLATRDGGEYMLA